ncbi:MAG: polyprenyl synthetase family protein [Bacteroidetes bacterium]|nr:MAG: polyprenyl synthetase family protein [Bacteroidota bacterium]
MSDLSKIKRPIESELKEFRTFFKSLLKTDTKLLNIVINYILRQKGKQLRPILVILTAKLFGKINKSTYVGATMIELMHTATLIHDDVVDNADKRRGMFSINALWKNKIAVLMGDYLLSQGLLISIENDEFNFLREISRTVKQMSEGELLQIEKSRKLDINEDIYYEIIKKKTAVLLSACTVLGAKSVNATNEQVEKVRELGENLGMAFQIKDDLFDLQKINNTGKPSGNDLQEKKITLPLIYSLQNSTEKQKKQILKIIGKSKKNKQNIEQIISFISEKKGIEYATKVMNDYTEKSLEIINQFPKSETKQAFILLINYITSRRK